MTAPRLPNLFKVPELKEKILFTLLCLVVYRIGAHIATPGVNVQALADFLRNQGQGTLFSLYDLFAGGQTRPGFEGGQMPLIRRIPKRGFTNPFKQPAQVVNVRHLGQLAEGVEVTPETLFGAGLVRRPDRPIKLLGMGDVQRKFSVKGVTVSASARSKIEQAGGSIAT